MEGKERYGLLAGRQFSGQLTCIGVELEEEEDEKEGEGLFHCCPVLEHCSHFGILVELCKGAWRRQYSRRRWGYLAML